MYQYFIGLKSEIQMVHRMFVLPVINVYLSNSLDIVLNLSANSALHITLQQYKRYLRTFDSVYIRSTLVCLLVSTYWSITKHCALAGMVLLVSLHMTTSQCRTFDRYSNLIVILLLSELAFKTKDVLVDLLNSFSKLVGNLSNSCTYHNTT